MGEFRRMEMGDVERDVEWNSSFDERETRARESAT